MKLQLKRGADEYSSVPMVHPFVVSRVSLSLISYYPFSCIVNLKAQQQSTVQVKI